MHTHNTHTGTDTHTHTHYYRAVSSDSLYRFRLNWIGEGKKIIVSPDHKAKDWLIITFLSMFKTLNTVLSFFLNNKNYFAFGMTLKMDPI